jgi:transcription termination/antitermination protein NusG
MNRLDNNGSFLCGSMEADSLKPKWYVLFVRSNQERRVAQHLSARLIEHFLPLYESVSQWRDRRVTLAKPLFSGYIFVKLALVDRSKALLVPNVVSLVGTRKAPSVVLEEEIEWIKRGMEHGKAEPYSYPTIGDPVVIMAGPMAGMNGVLSRVNNRARVVVRVNSISRVFAVEVDSNCVELAAPKTLFPESIKDEGVTCGRG